MQGPLNPNPPARRPSTFADRWDKSTSKAILQGILDAVTLPGDVYRGEVDPRSDEAIGRAFDLAGSVTLGAGAIPARANEMRMGIKAFHGSPHSFDKFSSERIGTGEGAQAYGHGLYFAEREGVAADYRRKLAGPAINGKLAWEDMPWLNSMSKDYATTALNKALASGLSGDEAAIAAAKELNEIGHLQSANHVRQPYYDAANANAALVGKDWKPEGGATYEVDIAANPEDFLDWDKPLSEQPANVRDALAKVVSPEEAQRIEFMSKRLDALNRAIDRGGASADTAIEEKRNLIAELDRIDPSIAKSPEMAAKLRQAGIPGIRYLDQGSRVSSGGELRGIEKTPNGYRATVAVLNKGRTKGPAFPTEAEARKWAEDIINSGTSNYVVFDDSLISILKKYGAVGPVLAALGLSQALPDQAEASEQQGGGW